MISSLFSSWNGPRKSFRQSACCGAGAWLRRGGWGWALALVAAPLLARAAEPRTPASSPRVSFLQAPEGAKQFSFSLAVPESPGARPQGYLTQRSGQALEELPSVPADIAQVYAGKQFSAFEIAVLADGTRYLAVLNEDSSAKFLNRNESALWYARLYLVPAGGGAKPELLREGYQSMGGDVSVPAQLQLPGLGTTKVKSLRTEIGYSYNGTQNGKPQIFSGRGTALQVTGSQLAAGGKLTLTVTVPEELAVTPDTQVFLRFEPIEPGLPERTASGKVTDFLTLGSARFAVTALAPDFSSATVSVVGGNLEETLKQQLQIGTQMPPFAQVELVSRRTVTREEVLAKARAATGVIFVFGDLPSSGSRFGSPYEPPMRPGGGSGLPLRPDEVAEQLGVQLDPKPLVVIVTRQISLSFLYEDLRNKNPEYLVLADFVDPLRTTFRLPQTGPAPWYGSSYSTGHEPSLRQLFNLPPNTLALTAFDPQGKVRYVKADAGSAFLPSLAEARAAVAGEKSGK